MKKWIVWCLASSLLLGLMGCGSKDAAVPYKDCPSVTGTVEAVAQDFLHLYTADHPGYPYGAQWEIPLGTAEAGPVPALKPGDTVTVYFDGNIMESDPLQVGEVYGIVRASAPPEE